MQTPDGFAEMSDDAVVEGLLSHRLGWIDQGIDLELREALEGFDACALCGWDPHRYTVGRRLGWSHADFLNACWALQRIVPDDDQFGDPFAVFEMPLHLIRMMRVAVRDAVSEPAADRLQCMMTLEHLRRAVTSDVFDTNPTWVDVCQRLVDIYGTALELALALGITVPGPGDG